MAEIIENHNEHKPSNGKVNAALTLGIIGTALSALNTSGGLFGMFGGRTAPYNANYGHFDNTPCGQNAGMTNEELYLERSQCQNYLDITKQYYEGKLDNQERLTNAFFDAYKRDIDNSFALYKNQRDSDDALSKRIDEVDKKVDIMAAIRPYQDALINCKIDKNAILADYNLSKRTCRMITGQLVLPNDPTITGFGSYQNCNCNNNN